MATSQAVTQTPTAISGLTDDTVYQIQVRGGQGVVLVETATSAPADDSSTANEVRVGDYFVAQNESGEDTYVWVPGAEPAWEMSHIVINEAITG